MSLSTISPAPAPAPAALPTRFFCRPNERLALLPVGPRRRHAAVVARRARAARRAAGIWWPGAWRGCSDRGASPHPALVLVWCLPDDLPIVQAALTPLDPITGAARSASGRGESSTTASGTTGRASPPRHGRVEAPRRCPTGSGSCGSTRPRPACHHPIPRPSASRRSIFTLITTADALKLRVAAALRQAGQIERAEIWGARDRREPVFQRPGH